MNSALALDARLSSFAWPETLPTLVLPGSLTVARIVFVYWSAEDAVKWLV
jgi:hypothetical protein